MTVTPQDASARTRVRTPKGIGTLVMVRTNTPQPVTGRGGRKHHNRCAGLPIGWCAVRLDGTNRLIGFPVEDVEPVAVDA